MATIFLMPNPINSDLEFIGRKVKDILKSSDFVIGEERKNTLRFLAGIDLRGKDFYLLNEHTDYDEKFKLAKKVSESNSAVLFSDAGTPCVSDPGYDFIDLCYSLNIKVKTLCFESSIMAALSASGFYAEKFVYAGFPPIKGDERKNFFKNLPINNMTTIFLERPYSIKKITDELKVVKNRIFIHQNIGFKEETFLRGFYKEIEKKRDLLTKAPFAVVIEGNNA
ncbi:MAG: hypothetical protein H5U39_06505 [Deferribacterales bacterium]|uniref:SAM-dependent methyltransferase n=1 Tax=Deferrivibrio essentukiensis TaxID=2880922 RepID=UPI0019947626|nr:SAM-dependent methyltransferase [Deferrivibrio essentukiensis]MBC7196886.1 hypothetical protein [Deferribacterales bacterium]MCB4203805.1 hypothetical protein [Deferrivibrio essentukiensis]